MPSFLSFRSVDVKAYSALLRAVRTTPLDGHRRIENEKFRIYRDTGCLVQPHILQNRERADYGSEAIVRLAKDLDMSKGVLYRCVRFYQKYPDVWIVPASA